MTMGGIQENHVSESFGSCMQSGSCLAPAVFRILMFWVYSLFLLATRTHEHRDQGCPTTGAQKKHINIRILQTMISGIPLILGLGIGMSNPYVYVVLGPYIKLSGGGGDHGTGSGRTSTWLLGGLSEWARSREDGE